LYFPLTTRMQSFQLAPAVVRRSPAGATSAPKGSSTIGWTREADSSVHHWKSAA
jgi:hypothetical protein